MSVQRDLIYDVGVCNGDDSAYYLHKGFRVVGIEANPLLIPALQQRFAKQMDEGRYTLVPIGIAQSEGTADFWVCDDHPEWSSFDREIASRRGSRHHRVSIATCRFASLLERFGTPFYCKIDIEGNDELCLEDLCHRTKPEYLSIEVIEGHRQIEQLADLGYTKFKIISQRTLRQPGSAMASLKAFLPVLPRRLLVTAEAKLTRYRSEGDWRFPGGASGSFGEQTRGNWLTASEALALNRIVQRGSDLSEWHDIHATLNS